ncbi:MAG: LamG-like jellyroll fold domain-containing protein [Planctomycetota bacterium]
MRIATGTFLFAMLAAYSWSPASSAQVPNGQALSLDEGAYVNVKGTALQITGSSISVEVWFRTKEGRGHIIETGMENRSPSDRQAGYALYMDFGGKVRFGVNNGVEGYKPERWDNTATRKAYNDGEWHHAAGVFLADGKTRVKIYVDGAEVPQKELRQVGAAQGALQGYILGEPPTRIGATSGGTPNYFNTFKGEIDELRVWKTALTAEDVAESFRGGMPRGGEGLVARWSFEEGEEKLKDAIGGEEAKMLKAEKPTEPTLDYDYSEYPGGLTGYTGYERNQIAHWTLKPAARQGVGKRGLCDPAVAKLADGTLVVCAAAWNDPKQPSQFFRSADQGATWTEFTTQGRRPSGAKPRMLSLGGKELALRAGEGHVFLSRGGGVTWQNAEGGVWPLPDAPDGDASVVRLAEAKLIAAATADGNSPIEGTTPPRRLPAPEGDRTGEHSVLLETTDGGATWSEPHPFLGYSETDAQLTKLADGRLLCTYNNLHVPFGILAILSDDDGKTWDKAHPVFLARAWGPAGGRPTSVQLEDGSILTVYCLQGYRDEGLDTVVEAVRWEVPPRGGAAKGIRGVPPLAGFEMEPHDRSKYPAQLYGYSGVERQEVAYLVQRPAIRATIGHRGLYKGALAKLPDGTLVATPSFRNQVKVYRSKDGAKSWEFVDFPGFGGKEMGVAVLRDGTLLNLHGGAVYRSTDGGKTWENNPVDCYEPDGKPIGFGLVRNVIEEADGTLVMVAGSGTYYNRNAPPARAWRFVSHDGGKTWGEVKELAIWSDPENMFDEAAFARLPDGRILAAGRVTDGHLPGGRPPAVGYPAANGSEYADHMLLAESGDGGFTWSAPRDFLDYSRVHAELLVLSDGRILSCYAAYHLPLGVFAVLSEDGGRTWSVDTPIELAISTRVYTGWPTSVEMEDGSIVTMYATGPYAGKSDFTLAETVRWTPPAKGDGP